VFVRDHIEDWIAESHYPRTATAKSRVLATPMDSPAQTAILYCQTKTISQELNKVISISELPLCRVDNSAVSRKLYYESAVP
jgi:hypothetical protein